MTSIWFSEFNKPRSAKGYKIKLIDSSNYMARVGAVLAGRSMTTGLVIGWYEGVAE